MRTCVARYNNAFSANIAKGMLESNGIPAWVANENMPYVTMPNTGLLAIELLVSEKDYLEAKRLLAASSSEE